METECVWTLYFYLLLFRITKSAFAEHIKKWAILSKWFIYLWPRVVCTSRNFSVQVLVSLGGAVG